jgi:cysteine-rich repeat protein
LAWLFSALLTVGACGQSSLAPHADAGLTADGKAGEVTTAPELPADAWSCTDVTEADRTKVIATGGSGDAGFVSGGSDASSPLEAEKSTDAAETSLFPDALSTGGIDGEIGADACPVDGSLDGNSVAQETGAKDSVACDHSDTQQADEAISGADAIDASDTMVASDVTPTDNALPDLSSTLVGQSCSSWGELLCNGPNQHQVLICDLGMWKLRQTCATNENCDESSSTCLPILQDCQSQTPGFAYCSGDTLQQCGPDRVTLVSTPCATCKNGVCQAARCGDGKVQSDEECDDGNTVPADGCETDCKTSRVVQLTAGLTHTCALLNEGNVRCWGDNSSGQLGLGVGDDLRDKHPYQIGLVQLGSPAIAIAAGAKHTCAMMVDASVRCWGSNSEGQLGLGHTNNIGDDETPNSSAAMVQLEATAVAIAAGGNVTCAILSDGTLRCWGQNDFGQLGLGNTNTIGDNELPSQSNAQVTLDDTVQVVGVGGDHTCVVLHNNRVRCWGRNDLAQLGTGDYVTIGDKEGPTAIPPLQMRTTDPVDSLALGITRTCAHLADSRGTLLCWGDNTDGGLGVGDISVQPLSSADSAVFEPDFPIVQVSMGEFHLCAVQSSSRVRCWGINNKGQVGLDNIATFGDNENIGSIGPIALGNGPGGQPIHVIATAAGGLHSCVLLEGGVVRCWGYNADGQLGLGLVSALPGPDYIGGTPSTVPALLDPLRMFSATN